MSIIEWKVIEGEGREVSMEVGREEKQKESIVLLCDVTVAVLVSELNERLVMLIPCYSE